MVYHLIYLNFVYLFITIAILNCNNDSQSDRDIFIPLLAFHSFIVPNPGSQTGCPPSKLPEDIFLANSVIGAPGRDSNRPFGDPNMAITGICGAGEFSGSLHVYELKSDASGGHMILRWNQRKVLNTAGVDFIVFENAFKLQGSTNLYFVEPLLVEVSIDNIHYCGFSPNYKGEIPGGVFQSPTQDREDWKSMAGLSPVLYNMSMNPMTNSELFSNSIRQPLGNVFYMNRSGGDGFDLDHLTNIGFRTNNSGSCTSTLLDSIKTSGFVYLKLSSAHSQNFPQPIGVFRESSDIDGVVARSVAVYP